MHRRAPSLACTVGKQNRLHTISAAPEMLSGRLSSEEEKSRPVVVHKGWHA